MVVVVVVVVVMIMMMMKMISNVFKEASSILFDSRIHRLSHALMGLIVAREDWAELTNACYVHWACIATEKEENLKGYSSQLEIALLDMLVLQGLGSPTLSHVCLASYCASGSSQPELCPEGTYSNKKGLTALQECNPCRAGFYCAARGQTAPSGHCEAGFYCWSRAVSPSLAQSACRECPPGMFCNQTGMVEPLTCPKGHYCPAQSTLPLLCPVFIFFCFPQGTYSDILGGTGIAICKLCPAGMYCSKSGLMAPEGPCQPGYYCLQGSSSASPGTTAQLAQNNPGTSPVQLGHGMSRKEARIPPGAYLAHLDSSAAAQAVFPQQDPVLQFTMFVMNMCVCEWQILKYCVLGTSMTRSSSVSFHSKTAFDAICLFLFLSGFYCRGGTRTARPLDRVTGELCPEGHFCPVGSAMPSPCQDGEYNAITGRDECFPCPAGLYCKNGRVCISTQGCSAVNGDCPLPLAPASQDSSAIQVLNVPSMPVPVSQTLMASSTRVPVVLALQDTFAQLAPESLCLVLQEPSQTAVGSLSPTSCPTGTFSNLLGRSMVSDCQLCPSGFYCEGSGLKAPTGECWEGYYCDNQQGPISDFTLYPCPQSYYCPPGTQKSTQYSCPSGTFGSKQRLKNIQECQICPSGKFCSSPGLAAPTGTLTPSACPSGTWSGDEGNQNLQNCQPCPAGHYCNGTGLAVPSGLCAAGFYCIAGAITPTPTDGISGAPCPVGHFCPLGSDRPTPCSPGFYMAETHRQEWCHTCPEGNYCIPGHLPQLCPKGFYCPEGTGLNWQPCPPGTYGPNQGASSHTECRACDGGKFCMHHNATDVTGTCWEGYYCTQGSDRPNPDTYLNGHAGPCPFGHYCPKGTAVPQQCPMGTFGARTKLSSEDECSHCLPGHYCDTPGLTTVRGPCEEGFYCTLGSMVPDPPVLDHSGGPCPTGYFCPQGTAVPLACPPGSYNPLPRQASCLTCPPGYFCPKNSSSLAGRKCPEGHYCPPGTVSETQFPCPRGTYNANTGSSDVSLCLSCEPGGYCNSAD
ncbi:hypothetical protein JD844_031443 [Phrynosoma platyrhinos]|uniref:Uncharacterized protein n=1 Tax=Phrynosoma platyrhinos TaxID=52577 RepID=A0ABQ7T0X3_PHRPL|nr:hypothetical protein JD844_031443 [Phrynosoma platyrhinos]